VDKQQPTKQGSKMPAIAQDVQRIRSVMQELETLETMLRYEEAIMELKGKIANVINCYDPCQITIRYIEVPSVLVLNTESEEYPDVVDEDSDGYFDKGSEILNDILDTMLYGETAKQVELKISIKELMTAPDFLECLNNLEVQGEPFGGLSSEDREMVMLAREKVKNY
jgi:hypothetical protein